MPLSHDDVTATVLVTGLALGCYNSSTQNWEIGFIRNPRHVLTIEVTKQLEDGDTSWMKFQLDANHRIFVDSEKAIAPESPIYTVGETFNRHDGEHDHEDFRWVVDFEKQLNGGEPVELKRPAVPVTEMYVSKPLLYADEDSFTLDPVLIVDTQDRTPTSISEFGFLTEGGKADIKCQAGGAVILRIEGPQGFQVHLPYGTGEPHFIHVDNTCPEHDEEDDDDDDEETTASTGPSDFFLFYDLIESTFGTKFDLKHREGGSGEGAVCNKGFLGVHDGLFPLP